MLKKNQPTTIKAALKRNQISAYQTKKRFFRQILKANKNLGGAASCTVFFTLKY